LTLFADLAARPSWVKPSVPTEYRRTVEVGSMRKIIGGLATVAAAGVLTFAALPVASASAGSNGQEVSVCTTSWAHKARVEGFNQNGVFYRDDIPVDPGQCWEGWNVTWDWWWKGTVTIFLAGDDGVFKVDHSCDVPPNQGGDIFWC
jgi:hypothetical protein